MLIGLMFGINALRQWLVSLGQGIILKATEIRMKSYTSKINERLIQQYNGDVKMEKSIHS